MDDCERPFRRGRSRSGLCLIVASVFDAIHVAAILLGLPLGSQHPLATDALAAVFYLVPGILMILGANLIVRVVYGRER